VPEALRSADAAVWALYAFGQHEAMGFCPFAIESITEPAQGLLAASYDLIEQLTPVILAQDGRGKMAGLLPPGPPQPQPQALRLGGCVLHVTYERAAPAALADGLVGATAVAPPLPAGGLVIATGPDEFIFAGTGLTVTFESPVAGEVLGILNVQEGRFVDGVWRGGRWLNGDQTHQGRHVRLEPGRFAIQCVKLYRYR
jgi:hypothetical protein